MKRWLLNILAAACGLLFVATAILWPASYLLPGFVSYGDVTPAYARICSFYTVGGCMRLDLFSLSLSGPGASSYYSIRDYPARYHRANGFQWGSYPLGADRAESIWQKVGFHWGYTRSSQIARQLRSNPAAVASDEMLIVVMSVPHWFACLLTLFPPTAWYVAWRQRLRRQRRVGHCRNCDYDLRAHKPGDRCPECGMIFSGKTTHESAQISTNQ